MRPATLTHQPGLEGLRGLAVAAVLLFHSGFGWAAGGYLGVSTFFTLSGYLLTALLLADWERSGRIDVGAFWSRRLRRLLPASFAALLLIALYAAFAADEAQLEGLRRSALMALFYLVNWHLVAEEVAYAGIFTAPSPVQHFWSLAIEMQFCVVHPLAVWLALRATRGSRAGLIALLVLATAGSVAVGFGLSAAGAWPDRTYYGSDTRLAELTWGALLAALTFGREPTPGLRRALSAAGLPALAIVLAAWSSVPLGAPWLPRGGLAAYGLVSALLLASALQPGSALGRGLSLPALRALGRISYGVYLYHWPVFLWLTPERTGLGPPALLALRSAIVLALSAASYHLLEEPVRRRRVAAGGRAWPAALAGAVVTAAALVAVTPPGGGTDGEAAPVVDATLPGIGIYGDSTALRLAFGLGAWLNRSGEARYVGGILRMGCGIANDGVRHALAENAPPRRSPKGCEKWQEEWSDRAERTSPSAAVVLVGIWEVTDRRLPGDDEFRVPGDPVLDAYLQGQIRKAVDLFAARGVRVIWLTSPYVAAKRRSELDPTRPSPAYDPARIDRLNALIRDVAAERRDALRVVEFGAYLQDVEGDPLTSALRLDGVHLSPESAKRVSADWLGPEILRALRSFEDRAPGGA